MQLSPMILETANSWVQIAAAVYHTCAIASNNSLLCWGKCYAWDLYPHPQTGMRVVVNIRLLHLMSAGQGGAGQLGNGVLADAWSPSLVNATVVSAWSLVTAGESHTCGLDLTGAGFCWGDCGYGQTGIGRSGDKNRITPYPEAIQATAGTLWTLLAAGKSHTCGLVAGSRAALCWGLGFSGQLGTPVRWSVDIPTRVATTMVTSWMVLAGGETLSCGISTASSAFCWGKFHRVQARDRAVCWLRRCGRLDSRWFYQ